ncbi:condensation domain-containing protein [Streptomyces sp. NRRL S-350]|uniref:condensation domain-containing protein n=1 Tax=Streptomyces sp. NRRL S-350 TaxID=1463902 RepID=UPI0004C12CC8|nr:condensation domain-containing protein [Streptomyces sp. NRRL S-350]
MTTASFAQERAWLASRFAADTALYHVADRWPLHGDVSEAQIRAALAAVADRHETLRTGFRVVDGVLTAVVHEHVDLDLEVVDLSARTEEEQREEREAFADRLKHTAFDLSRAPLWRAGLVRLGAGRWRLLFVAHHAVCDTPSLFNLHAEVTEFCAAFEQDRPPRVPRLPLSYGDYARRQRERLGGGELAALADYWRTQLAGLPAAHGLPLDRPRPARRSFAGAELRAELPAGPASALTDAAGRFGATPFELLLAGYAALVHRRSGRDDIAVGVPLTGRDRPELLPLVGTFVNMVVLRLDTSGDPSYAGLVERVRAVWRAARDHQEMPFQTVVEQVAPQRGPGLPPLYQLAFNVTAGEGFGPPSTGAEDDLLLEVSGTTARLEYNTALFGRKTAEGLLADYAAVLTAALADPATPLSRLPAGPGPAGGAAPDPRPGHVPPRTPAEELVARAWADVLGVDRVGVDDDFFAAGGHSLQALRLLARLSSDHRVETTVDAFFSNPTVAGLAAELERHTATRREHRTDPEGETWQ